MLLKKDPDKDMFDIANIVEPSLIDGKEEREHAEEMDNIKQEDTMDFYYY